MTGEKILNGRLTAAHDAGLINENALTDVLQQLLEGEALTLPMLCQVFGSVTIGDLVAELITTVIVRVDRQRSRMSPHQRPFPKPADPGKRPPRIQIFLKHHNDPEGKFAPQHATCETDPEKHRVGCGGSIVFYRTYPNEKRMPFDSPPIVVEQFPARQDGAIIAMVETTNVHFATCPKRAHAEDRSTTGFRDGRALAAGGDR